MMTDAEFRDVLVIAEGYCKILGVLIPKIRASTATADEQNAYAQSVAGLSSCRDRIAGGIVQKWERYAELKQMAARVPGGGPAIAPVLESLRDLVRFQMLDNPAMQSAWQPWLAQIESDLHQYQH